MPKDGRGVRARRRRAGKCACPGPCAGRGRRFPLAALNLSAQGLRVDQLPLVSLVDGALEAVGGFERGEVDESLDDPGDGDIVVRRQPLRSQSSPTAHLDSPPARGRMRCAEFDQPLPPPLGELPKPLTADPVERGRAPMAQHCSLPADQDSSHPPSLPVHLAAPDRVNAVHQWMQAARCNAVLDRLRREPERQQLSA